MVSRRRVEVLQPTEEVPVDPPVVAAVLSSMLDHDRFMLALAAREEALKVIPTPSVRVARTADGGRQFFIGDAPVGATSFGSVCEFLDVPSGFMKRAPVDLANKIAARMLKEPMVEDRELVFNVVYSSVVGHRPKGQRFVPAARVFERVFEDLPETEGIYLHETDRAVDASIVCRSLNIEPRKGDVVRGGLQCLYSEIGGRKAGIRAYSERLVCTNGMTHREFDREFGIPDDLGEFLDEIGLAVRACCDYVRSSLEPKMRRATEFEVNGPQAIRRIFRQSRLPARYLDDVLAAHAIEDDGTAYGVLQAFTRAANSLRYDVRTRLQAVAGDELTVVEKAHCPACYAPL